MMVLGRRGGYLLRPLTESTEGTLQRVTFGEVGTPRADVQLTGRRFAGDGLCPISKIPSAGKYKDAVV